jgi:membrane-anchored mycosin MYCP
MAPPHQQETLGEGDTMNIRRGWVEAFHDDELVVALPDLRVLQAALYEYGVRFGDGHVDTNAVLGLARLTGLTGIAGAVQRLEQEPAVGPLLGDYRATRNRAHDGAPDVSELALLIRGVQLLFADRYPGWQVTIGKNYRPAMVKGYPHIGGGEGEPTPTGEPFTRAVAGGPPRPDAGHGVRVGLADTRLYEHDRLAGHYFVGDEDHDLLPAGRPEDTEFDGHAAFVASCILQQAPRAEIHLRSVLDDRGDGSAWDAAVGLAELVPLGLDVLNLSFGEYMTDDGTAPMVLDAAVRRFSRDTVIVAAAGNNGNVPAAGPRPAGVPAGVGPRTTSYPAGLPDVVGVGAVDANNERAPFSPPAVPWISLLARGSDLVGAYVSGKVPLSGPGRDAARIVEFGGAANWAGCSFAAGVVTGVIAARTEPGHRSAREALDELVPSLADQPRPGLLLNPARY